MVTPCYEVRDPLDMASLAAAMAGACAGFLWWNASPAKIFMGDVGSLALGGAIAGMAITLRTEMLLVALGGLFVLITLSVILQVGYFKISGGKRIFKMAPLQHHKIAVQMGRDMSLSEAIRLDQLVGARQSRAIDPTAHVKDYLASLGVAADRLQQVSKGEESPVCSDENEGCYSRNRRGTFVFTSK